MHVTIAYHENTRETLTRFGEWNQRFETYPDLIRPVYEPADIDRAKAEGRIGIIFGAQNCSPIEDEIRLVEVMRRLGLMIMQLTYNNQSLLPAVATRRRTAADSLWAAGHPRDEPGRYGGRYVAQRRAFHAGSDRLF